MLFKGLMAFAAIALIAFVGVGFWDRYQAHLVRTEIEMTNTRMELERLGQEAEEEERAQAQADAAAEAQRCRIYVRQYDRMVERNDRPISSEPEDVLRRAEECGVEVPESYYAAVRAEQRITPE